MELRLLFLFFLILHLAAVSSQVDHSHNLHNEGEEAFSNVDKLPTQPEEGNGKDELNKKELPNRFKAYDYAIPQNVGKDVLNHKVEPDWLSFFYDAGAPEKIGKDLLNHKVQPNWLPFFYGKIGKGLLNHKAQPDCLTSFYGVGAPMEDSKLMKGSVANFFLENDLLIGKTMKLHFTNPITDAKFLPRDIAKSIPLARNKLPEILNRFNIEPKSSYEEIVKQTISVCERQKSTEAEHMYCATSLESLIDFSRSKLGEDLKIFSTEVNEENEQVYKIIKESIVKLGDKSVVCHKLNYMYAVYYCHHVHATKVYMATLEGENGIKENAIAACHADTKGWNPKHLAFQLLNVKPGTDTICHFLSSDTLVLVPQKDKDVSY